MLSPKGGTLSNSFQNPSSAIMLDRYTASFLACAIEMSSASKSRLRRHVLERSLESQWSSSQHEQVAGI